jgi:protein gp37
VSATSIEWTDVTWNPIRGCSVISPGCVNCYAMKQAHRFSGAGKAYESLTKLTTAGPQWTGFIKEVHSALSEPVRWRNPKRVFVNSMSDLFHENVSFDFIDQVFGVMAGCRYLARRGDVFDGHTFQVLTKRPARMREYLSRDRRAAWARAAAMHCGGKDPDGIHDQALYGPPALPNVWLGVSVENQKYADERIPLLLETPAAVRFISYEPALGPLDLQRVPIPAPGAASYGLTGVAQPLTEKDTEPDDWKYWTKHGANLDWVIVGGESGPGARPFDIAWARAVVQQCAAAGVACFVKQLGACAYQRDDNYGTEGIFDPYKVSVLVTGDRKGGEMSEWPADLRVRQFPEVRA